jgi:hypothetical protein
MTEIPARTSLRFDKSLTISMALITLTVCAVYMAVFETQNQAIFNMTVVILTLAFGTQTKMSFLEY